MTPPLALVTTSASAPVTQLGARQRREHRSNPLRVREWPLRYEQEGSERIARGAVTLPADAWWSVALTVPDGHQHADDDAVFVRMERHGPLPVGYVGSAEIQLSLPRSEIDAIVVLLGGVVEQARRDAVLSARAS